MTALNHHFFAISLFIAADLPSWLHLCLIVWICRFARNLFALSSQLCRFAWYVLHRFIPLCQSSVAVFDLRIVFLNRLFAVRIRCWICWILDVLAEIIYKSPIIVWCEEANPMWWLSWITASCEEIGCMFRQCLFHLVTNPMLCGSPTRWTIAQSLPFSIRCHLFFVLALSQIFRPILGWFGNHKMLLIRFEQIGCHSPFILCSPSQSDVVCFWLSHCRFQFTQSLNSRL